MSFKITNNWRLSLRRCLNTHRLEVLNIIFEEFHDYGTVVCAQDGLMSGGIDILGVGIELTDVGLPFADLAVPRPPGRVTSVINFAIAGEAFLPEVRDVGLMELRASGCVDERELFPKNHLSTPAVDPTLTSKFLLSSLSANQIV